MLYDTAIGSFPGVNQFASHREGAAYVDLSRISLPIPERFPPGQLPVVPLTARNDTIYAWDPDRVTPYVQNSSLEVQRAIARDLTVAVRYIGTKGTKLYAGIPQNYTDVFSNGLLEAFNLTRSVPGEQVVKAFTLGAGDFDVAYRVVLSQIRPRVLNSVRLNLKAVMLFLFAGEMIASTDGLAYRIALLRRHMGMDVIIPYVLWVALLLFLVDLSMRWLNRTLHPWFKEA